RYHSKLSRREGCGKYSKDSDQVRRSRQRGPKPPCSLSPTPLKRFLVNKNRFFMARNEVPKSIRASLYIDGKPAQNSMKNVEQVARTLRRELNGLTIGTAEWNAKMRELKTHQATLRGIRNEVNGVGGAFGWLKTELGKLG